MIVSRRRALLTIVLFAGVLSIGPFIAPTTGVDVVAAPDLQDDGGAAFGSTRHAAADIVGGEMKDATGVPEPGLPGWRLLALALLAVGLGLVEPVAGPRPVERRPLRLRPVVALLPDRRGPPLVAV